VPTYTTCTHFCREVRSVENFSVMRTFAKAGRDLSSRASRPDSPDVNAHQAVAITLLVEADADAPNVGLRGSLRHLFAPVPVCATEQAQKGSVNRLAG
jgi:hypothetical protein